MTTVSLDNLGLHKLAHLDRLLNLRWLSLASNALTSLEVYKLGPSECVFSNEAWLLRRVS